MSPVLQPRFLAVDDTPLGGRFVIHHAPAGVPAHALVVYVHPFAEEMNKARRMAALQARALAAAGLAVLQIDLLGCGDSAGDFGDADWDRWVEDVVAAVHWLRRQHAADAATPAPDLWLWGLRAGSLLAVQAAARLAAAGLRCHFLFWQPAPAGKLLLQQFLRLKAASELLSGQAREAMTELRSTLAAGRTVEIAGYTLAPALCQGFERAVLQPPPTLPAGQVIWLEVSPATQAGLAPAGAATLAAWRDAGWRVHAQAVNGPMFWQTTEIEDAPALIDATLAAVATNPAATAVVLEASAA